MRKLLLLLCIISIILCGCNKEEPETPVEDTSMYATNDVKKQKNNADDLSTKDTLDPITLTPESTETSNNRNATVDDEYIMKYVYDASKQGDSIMTFRNIVIDNMLLEFPCSYDYLLSKFGTLYEYEEPTGKWPEKYNEVDESKVSNKMVLRAIPITGVGTIEFVFYSDDFTSEGTIKDLICKQVSLSGGSYDPNEKTMTIALYKGVSFGFTTQEITSIYGSPSDKISKNAKSFIYKYESHTSDEDKKYELLLYGKDNGLQSLTIKFFKK